MLDRTFLGVLLVLTLLACSSNGDGPPDPFFDPGKEFGGAIPPDAQIISNEAFKQLALQEGFVWDSLALRAERETQRTAQRTADRAEITRLAPDNPAYRRMLAPAAPGVEVLPDGNYLREVQGKSGPITLLLDGPAVQMRSALAGKARYETPANQLLAYTNGYEALSEEQRRGLPTPQSLSNASFATLRQARLDLSARIAENPNLLEDAQALPQYATPLANPGAKPPGYPSSPSQEEGQGLANDRSGSCIHNDYDPNGLYANFWWRQKYYHTSIKQYQQAVYGRDTCVAFALAGALESKIAIEQGRWVNLSEQFLWSKIAAEWDPRLVGDGADLIDQSLQFYQSGFKLPLEEAWNYNPSKDRQYAGGYPDPSYYVKSCLGYLGPQSEFCSESSAQRRPWCTLVGSKYFCGATTPAANGEKFGMGEPVVLYDGAYINDYLSGLPLEEIRLALKAGYPLVVSFTTNSYNGSGPYFDEDGLSGSGGVNYGSSTALITGYIPSIAILAHPTLDASVKAMALKTSGFLVLKTFYGFCYGDAGYAYLSAGASAPLIQSVVAFKTNPSAQFKGGPPNIPPTVTITAPNGGNFTQLPFRQPVTFTAQASDPDSNQPPTISWSSDADEPMGSGSSIQFTFTSPGSRVITATATDNQGATTKDTMTFVGLNLNPTAQILSPLTSATIYANDTQVQFTGKGSDQDGALFPFDLPCASLAWSSSNAADNPLGSGCSFSKVFTATGTRTITLTATDAHGAKGTATVVLNVTQKPASGPPVVHITSPEEGDSFDATQFIRLAYTLSDPGGSPNTRYRVVWKISAPGVSEKVINPQTCTVLGLSYPCFKPSDYGFSSTARQAQLSLAVTDPEELTGTDQVNITIGTVN